MKDGTIVDGIDGTVVDWIGGTIVGSVDGLFNCYVDPGEGT